MELSHFFQLGPLPPYQMKGIYDLPLVFLSFCIAFMASYLALDITNRFRKNQEKNIYVILFWVLTGGIVMGLGIWSMHFIGMIAYQMPMKMQYDLSMTLLSLLIAVVASSFAFYLIRNLIVNNLYLLLGGIVLGCAIAFMHYLGMASMENVEIHYKPGLFFLSLFIAVLASEIALFIMIKIPQSIKHRNVLQIASASIMGLAICGMHYVGMYAAVFSNIGLSTEDVVQDEKLTSRVLSILIGVATTILLMIVVIASRIWVQVVELKNKQLLEKETELAAVFQKMISTAKLAGMAEVAAGVLHNIGNILNSINITTQLLLDRDNSSSIAALRKFAQIIDQNKDNLENFLAHDPVGKNLPEYISEYAKYWKNEESFLKEEIESLAVKVDNIKKIVRMQENFKGDTDYIEEVDLNKLIEDALTIVSIDLIKDDIQLIKKLDLLPKVELDKVRTIQIIVNLLKNAREALVVSNNPNKTITISTQALPDDKIEIRIEDNGIGIKVEDLSKIFTYGYTTKKNGHGIGLHSSLISANQSKGYLIAASLGLNQGAVFTLTLPSYSKIGKALC